jgi:hypothetical protein
VGRIVAGHRDTRLPRTEEHCRANGSRDVAMDSLYLTMQIATSSGGTLAYVPGADRGIGKLVTVDRVGRERTLPAPPNQVRHVRSLSDGYRCCRSRRGCPGLRVDLRPDPTRGTKGRRQRWPRISSMELHGNGSWLFVWADRRSGVYAVGPNDAQQRAT